VIKVEPFFNAPSTHQYKMELNSEQAAAFAAVQTGKNLFLTGPAGSGKSFLIRRIMEWSDSMRKTLAVTALTGCAALLLGNKAKTLHSWAGIGLGRGTVDALVTSINKNPHSKRRWKRTEILIIDEISMMTPELFEKLDAIGKRVRNSTRPWGGIQLILCGDYFQLPPVVKGISGETAGAGRFAFESPAWAASALTPIVLNKIERQTDTNFQKLLNECRIGEPSPETITLLKSRQGLDWKSRAIKPTLLFSRNADVDTINEKNIAALKKTLFTFDAETVVARNPEYPDIPMPTGEELERIVAKLDNDANYAPHLELCVGAQVMLLVNKDIEAGLVNGSRGVIIDFNPDGLPIVQFLRGDPTLISLNDYESNECPHVTRKQLPLRVAYAVTIHKSQGATLDCALVDIGASTFEYGQAYVALSRVRDLESLYIHNLVASKIKAHPAVVEFYNHLMDAPTAPPVPITAAGDFGVDLTDEGWRGIVAAWAATATGGTCLSQVAERQAATTVYPPPAHILHALKVTPLRAVKVVILGQDPYHGPDQAHGLSFSICGGALPPSLRNIRKELLDDLTLPESAWPLSTGNLTAWASQGVLLLNAVLTVEAGKPDSHAGMGWEDLTQRLLGTVIATHADDPLVFVAWGRKAQNVVYRLKLGAKHKIIDGVHPSPLSAPNGFFGSKPFSKVNGLLSAAGAIPIDWKLSTTATVATAGAGCDDPSN
jgi:ATP-dependent DNA helicase PIF1